MGLFFAEEVPQEGTTDSRFSVKCRWYRSVITKTGQVRHFLSNSWNHYPSLAVMSFTDYLETSVSKHVFYFPSTGMLGSP